MVFSPSAHLTSLAIETSLSLTSKAFAEFLDKTDDLAALRSNFLFPKVKSIKDTAVRTQHASLKNTDLDPIDALTVDDECVYMIGNSLGLQPKGTRELLNQELDVWAERGVNGHFDHPHSRPWVSIDDTVIEESAKIVGAHPQEYKIIMETKAFPSDYVRGRSFVTFAIASQVKFHGFDASTAGGEYTLRLDDILEVIEKEGDETALVLFSGVQYYTGQFFNLKAITDAAKEKGCVVGFDLAHAVGKHFACWVIHTRHLVGGAFIHERHATADLPRFAGWWGADPSTKFIMDNVFRAIPGASGYRVSNPSVVSTISLLGSLQIFSQTSIAKLREKSLSLTAYLELLLDELDSDAFMVLTPRDPLQRGAQLSLWDMAVQGVICDERRPDVIRVSPAPLYCTFVDVWRVVEALKVALSV
ncbi:pyridoxal phosphate-dependent transferase [Chytridium lagenaria]|nr:pyridoxal phosphate-dependent transferase [Chytridium lagenaria]